MTNIKKLAIVISIMLLLFPLLAPTKVEAQNSGTLAKFTPVRYLTPNSNVNLRTTLPLGEPEARVGSEDWDTSYKRFGGIYKISSRDPENFTLIIKKSSKILIKVEATNVTPGKLLARLYREDQREPLWTIEAEMINRSIGIISKQVWITKYMISNGTEWKVMIANDGDSAVFARIIIEAEDMTRTVLEKVEEQCGARKGDPSCRYVLENIAFMKIREREVGAGRPPLEMGSSLGGRVWGDSNANGIKDPEEIGIIQVNVNLYDSDGFLVDWRITNSTGYYNFAYLPPGNYSIEFIKPSGFVFSPKNKGSDNTKDSDPDPRTGQIELIKLKQGQNDTAWDAGMYRYPL